MSPWWKRVTDPAPDPQLDRGARQRLMVAAAPPVVPADSPHADVAGWRIHAEQLERQLHEESMAHADTIALVERLRATPTPEDLWMEVRVSEEGQRARHFQRMYGKASATIGALRDQLARVRAQREDAESVVVAVAVALGCGPQPSEQWLLDTAVRAGKLLAQDGETFRRKLLDAAAAADEPDGMEHAGALAWGGGAPTGAPIPADAALVERARVLGDEIGQRDRTAAVEGAAITLRAHTHKVLDSWGSDRCGCGWSGTDHPHHVAEQLAAVGALGNHAATPPDLIDKDGDRWRWYAGYKHGNGPLVLRSREELVAASWGPLTEATEPEDVPW